MKTIAALFLTLALMSGLTLLALIVLPLAAAWQFMGLAIEEKRQYVERECS
jgi:hypothetical protein